jgi:flagellar basal-body rod protein FlgG
MILQFTRLVQGALRQERRFQITSNNLANVDTPSFKEDVLSFDWRLKAHLTVNHTQGPVRETGNPLDVALTDEGFFKVMTPYGERYTRDGRFTVNSAGELVTQSGDQVLGENGPIIIEGNKVDINAGGEFTGSIQPVNIKLVLLEINVFLDSEIAVLVGSANGDVNISYPTLF